MTRKELLRNLALLFEAAIKNRQPETRDELFSMAASIREAITEFVPDLGMSNPCAELPPAALDFMSRSYLLPGESLNEGIKRVMTTVIDEMVPKPEQRMHRYGQTTREPVVLVVDPNEPSRYITSLLEKAAKTEPPGSGGYINKNGVRVPNPCGEMDQYGRNYDLAGREIRQNESFEECFERLKREGVDIISPNARVNYGKPRMDQKPTERS